MNLLLDTHAALWWWRDSPLLGEAARAAIEDAAAVHVSAASAAEVAIKRRVGKLDDIGDPAVNFPKLMALHGFLSLAITEAHALRAGQLAGRHRDPFDRIIAAQALHGGLIVVTTDSAIAAFGCKVLW